MTGTHFKNEVNKVSKNQLFGNQIVMIEEIVKREMINKYKSFDELNDMSF